MSSILNSISSGDLQVQNIPREFPVKKDSIIELLQNSEIEFEFNSKNENPDKNVLIDSDLEINLNLELEKDKTEEQIEEIVDIENLLQNSEITLDNESNVDDFNTGFGKNNDLHYDTPCKIPELKTPLYQENYLREFVTEEEKAAARHALGLYNKEDIVALSLLTSENVLPTRDDWQNASIQQLRKGDKFFTPITSFDAVYDSSGVTLTNHISTIQSLISESKKEINKINQVSNAPTISSLGDVRVFLQGFNNGSNLFQTLNEMDKAMIRFEKTGQIV